MNRNIVRPLELGTPRIPALLVENVDHYRVQGPAVVVNPHPDPVRLDVAPSVTIPALSSTILTGTTIVSAPSVIVVAATDAPAADVIRAPGWHLLSELMPSFPPATPLWKGPQAAAGSARLDAPHLLGERADRRQEETFDIRVNLWYAPAGTDCAIHDEHDFIEIHTQITGVGRMQKFHARDHSTLYQDIPMAPGYTTPQPFCRTAPDGGYRYPWHQYRADTDCVWLAVEYHRPAR
ncbi:hypothetical protein GCM10018980_76960 [Streptomyces capoamus]|uniref:Uncharacterized protein n=1 Tax=Streptomyces capoamus TaxID=68183 RepID=A0A919KGC0_9ACTN|nr:hypothetical protein [Streptomyces capoamus]GGP32949.1 hypothetical protein GCM10010501_76150 [Streptomyces libani subsp. rufus]GHG78253.1 hypothetical protein GCM10018980_76960 [Streptomyces capoamus]